LTIIKTLPSKSQNLIYFDPPFGITEAEYDKKLDWENLWNEMWRVLKDKGNIVIHSSQPFTFDLVNTQRKHFKYCWYWDKGRKTGHLFSKKQPLRQLEEICVFYKKGVYYPQTIKKDKPDIVKNTKGAYYHRTQNKTYICDKIYPSNVLVYKRINHKYSTRPTELIEYLLNTYTLENENVLDLTCSNSQTGKVCKKIKRNYIGIDINPQMIEDAKKNVIIE